jgi:hypothetical protein
LIIRLLISALLGGALIIFGVLLGATSHQVTYNAVNQETVAHFLSGDSSSSDKRGFLQFEKDPKLYLINESDFTPKVDGNSFGDGDVISFVYRTDSPTNIDVKASNTSTHLAGDAYTIEKITAPGSNGQGSKVYTSSEYSQNPKGFYQNNWPLAAIVIVLGLIIAALAFFLPMLRGRNRNKAQPASDASPISMGMPFGAQPPVNAYGQNPNQFPQYPQQIPAQFQRPPFTPPPGQFNTPPQYPRQPGQFNTPPQYPPQPGQFNMPAQYPQQGGSYEPTQRADPPRN